MDHLYASATDELQKELGDSNFKVIYDDRAKEYQILQFKPGEGWIVSACYPQWTPKEIREYKMYYHESHEGRKEFGEWRERRQKEREMNKIRDDVEASQIAHETGADTWKFLRDNHAVKQGVW